MGSRSARLLVCCSRFFSSIANGYAAAAAALLAADLELLELQIFFSPHFGEGYSVMPVCLGFSGFLYSWDSCARLRLFCRSVFLVGQEVWFVFAAATNSELAEVLAY